MEDYFSEKAIKESMIDMYAFGTSVLYIKNRSKWNPLKYLMGEVKYIRIHPSKIRLGYKKVKF